MRRLKENRDSKDACIGKRMDTCVCCVDCFCAYVKPSSHSTKARGGRGSFHSLLSYYRDLPHYFLGTFGRVYTGQDTFFFCIIYTLLWMLGDEVKKIKREKAESKRGRVEEEGIKMTREVDRLWTK